MSSMLETVKIVRHANAEVADQTAITPANGVDLLGFTHAVFLVILGAADTGSAPTVKLQQSNDDGVSDNYSDIATSAFVAADTDDNKIIAVELIHFKKRYVRAVVTRAGVDVAVDGILCILSGADKLPVTKVTIGNETIAFPVEGTA